MAFIEEWWCAVCALGSTSDRSFVSFREIDGQEVAIFLCDDCARVFALRGEDVREARRIVK